MSGANLGNTAFSFIYTHPGTSTEDGRTKRMREFRTSTSVPPTRMDVRAPSFDDEHLPRKRARTAPAPTLQAKRPVGRPRKDTSYGGVLVEFGTFSTRTVAPPKAAQNVPLAPIFGTRLPRQSASEPTTRVPTPTASANPLPPPGPVTPPVVPSDQCTIPEENIAEGTNHAGIADDESSADGAGLGEPDDDSDDEDAGEEEGDLEDDGELEDGAVPKKKTRNRIPLPEEVKKAFDGHIEECRTRNHLGQPRLYWYNKTFRFPQQATWFSLQKPDLSPQKLYNPAFFLWDPRALVKIPCPNCSTELQRHTHIERPRRCVSFASTFWIIGFRYRCSQCSRSKPAGKNVTFRSWDSRILAVLPPALAAEFPARLSHRSAVDVDMVEWMRSCFQTGMGSKQFSDVLRVQHLLQYDKLHLQYLQHISKNTLDDWMGTKYAGFLPFTDRSPAGFHGYIPGGQLLRTVYDRYIEQHGHHFDQHTSLLSAEVNALDHSHKFTKYLIRVNGEKVFTALLTVTNERGEIRLCCLVATKAHSQFEMALKELSRSLDLYGLKQPLIFYTDNMSDRQFLMKIFPSLSADTAPVEKYEHLPLFTVPQDVRISIRNTAASINSAVQAIMDDLPEDGEGHLVVGFDTEWNVQTGPNDRIVGRSPTAIVQIAYKKQIYIFQVADMVRSGALPQQLKIFLSNPQILKVGRLIESDLKVLEKACNSPTPFRGAVDLAKVAEERYISLSRKAPALHDICAEVLGRCLRKNIPDRVGEAWERETLTSSQVEYAACDAYVALALYNRMTLTPIPSPLVAGAPLPPPGTPILLFGPSNSLIARGCATTQPADGVYDSIVLHLSKLVVEVQEAIVPGALIMSHCKQPLSAFGELPYRVVADRQYVRIHYSTVLPANDPARSACDHQSIGSTSQPAPFQDFQHAGSENTMTQAQPADPLDDSGPQGYSDVDPESLAGIIYDLADVGTLNSTGRRYLGHFSIWITNEIQQYLIVLKDKLLNSINMNHWLNTSFYQPTKEVIGVLPIPMEVQRASGIAQWIDGVGTNMGTGAKHTRSTRHDYLAKLQGTRKAVLPIHTRSEQQIFRDLMQSNPDFGPSSSAQPNWDKAVKTWNQLADTNDSLAIYGKAPTDNLSSPHA
ncbi:hypothetical protein D9611_000570 [Ephemerocybe angulata]|uniref:3'-5' exonuclease domain-containing protein n=1 Tax=Ephemerocybe angulata TaxID=980116 RepID=A0A8H5F7D3_9AGAR|nr:hypothetical protein D9611_000570 [Tulosesus angulatus]